jgi:hypothetical protein
MTLQSSAPEGWNLTLNKDFKYIDEDSASECSEYSFIDDYVPQIKKNKKTFKSVMTKEEFLPE